MDRLIAVCGINCGECSARKATIADDDALRALTLEEWTNQFGLPNLPIEAINCMGCRIDGIKFAHCTECQIRNCAIEKNFDTCGDCPELLSCDIVGQIHKAVPAILDNLLKK